MTAPDHMPRNGQRNACINGAVHSINIESRLTCRRIRPPFPSMVSPSITRAWPDTSAWTGHDKALAESTMQAAMVRTNT